MTELNQKSVLVVDSDEAILANISNGLKKRGMIVMTAPDGYEGYLRACEEKPQVVIANDVLPSISGYKISRLLKFDVRYKQIQVIIMSSSSGANTEKVFSQSGADKLLSKPFKFKEILGLIQESINWTRLLTLH